MEHNLSLLVTHITPFLENLSSSELAKLNKKIGNDLRRSQQSRIAAQLNPDGSSYTPRRLRDGKRLRKKMFSKLKTYKYFRNLSNAERVSVGFINSIGRIAKVHQFGLRDRVEKNGPTTTYSRRELLGFTDAEILRIEQSVLRHLKK